MVFRTLAVRNIGRLATLRRLIAEYLDDAARRSDRYVETTIVRAGILSWLGADDVVGARAALAAHRWLPPEGDITSNIGTSCAPSASSRCTRARPRAGSNPHAAGERVPSAPFSSASSRPAPRSG